MDYETIVKKLWLTPHNNLKITLYIKDKSIVNEIEVNKMITLDVPIIINGVVTTCDVFKIDIIDKTFSISLFKHDNNVMYTTRYNSVNTSIRITKREKKVIINIYEDFD